MTRAVSVASALFITGMMVTHGAGAQTPADKAAAEALFQQGRALTKEGRIGEACAKFADSQRLDPALGTELNLARCYEANGQTASAWALYKDVAVVAERAGQRDRSRLARRHAVDLEKHLSRMTIELTPPAGGTESDLSLQRDGKVVDRAEWNVPIPLDPGEHTIAATAPGRQSWSTKVTLAAGDSVTVSVPPLAIASAPSPTTEAPASPGTNGVPNAPQPPDSPPTKSHEPADSGRTLRTVAVVVGGTGLVGLAVGSVFGIVAKNTYDGAHCPTVVTCSSDGLDATAAAHSDATAATVLFAVGGAALAGGVVLYLLSSSKSGSAPSTALSIGPGVRGGPSVTLGASW